jgi:hypothetical protein
LYLNGREVYRTPYPNINFWVEETVSDLNLHAGINTLVFNVVQADKADYDGEWKGSIRFTDAMGNEIKGIEVTLDPDGKDRP